MNNHERIANLRRSANAATQLAILAVTNNRMEAADRWFSIAQACRQQVILIQGQDSQ